jgi:transposase
MHRQGMSIRAIGRELGVSRNTVRRYLRAAPVPEPEARSAKPTKLDDFRTYLASRVEAAHPDWIPATVLFDEIVALGYAGCVRTVRAHLATLKPTRRDDPLVRFETPPGRQMQVDWGAFRLGGQRISLFLATLGWSRFTFGVFVENEQFGTLRDCHEQAFDAFGGVPFEVLYDNMRTVVQQRNAYGRGLHQFHPASRIWPTTTPSCRGCACPIAPRPRARWNAPLATSGAASLCLWSVVTNNLASSWISIR